MTEKGTQGAILIFEANVRLVNELMDFDRTVVKFALHHLEQRQKYLEKAGILNQYSSLRSAIDQLRAIREHDSLRSQYRAILNQGVVLLVSYFGSAVSDLLSAGIANALGNRQSEALLKKEIKIALEDILNVDPNHEESVADLVIEKSDISFQDMKSISRAFRELLNIEPVKDNHVNNIIVAQACRHLIVHSGGIGDHAFVNQLRSANPRDLKHDVKKGDSVAFTREEISVVSESMKQYLNRLAKGINEYLPKVDQ
ncbi:MAG: hypothetical protein ACRDGA_11875 [Bacteroidota bacterium]